MYCPKCATDNLNTARFCRACGTDISMVPQALSGNVVQPQMVLTEGEREESPDLERGIKKFLMGMIFLVIAIWPLFTGHGLWWWMLFPAAPLLSAGIAEYVRLKQRHSMALRAPRMMPAGSIPQATVPPASQVESLPPRNTNDLYPPPPSVTEGTTRHLGAEGPTKYFNAPAERSKDNV